MTFKYVEVRELATTTMIDSQGCEQELVIIEGADGHVSAVLASFIEQEVAPLQSPYGHYEYVFRDDDRFYRNDGDMVNDSEVECIFTDTVKFDPKLGLV